jgi:hypothetical protein
MGRQIRSDIVWIRGDGRSYRALQVFENLVSGNLFAIVAILAITSSIAVVAGRSKFPSIQADI